MRPENIEQKSMDIIDSEAKGAGQEVPLDPDEYAVARRMVHATADFDFFKNSRFHPQAIEAGIKAINRKAGIVADTMMLKAGMTHLSRTAPVTVRISEPDVVQQALREKTTRATISMRQSAANMEGGIVVIGNAPTALMEVIRMIREGEAQPALVIGIPVGFVGAAESKEELLSLETPYITVLGRKGGSPAAAAAINAIAKLAKQQS